MTPPRLPHPEVASVVRWVTGSKRRGNEVAFAYLSDEKTPSVAEQLAKCLNI